MTAISLTFLAGRYHATPWGRHVNEGAVEWPPSPWRLLRALIATWKRTLPDLPEEQVGPVLRALAESPPVFFLPPASTGHTRHYVPWFKKGPDDRTLVFDTFVVVPRDAQLIVRWPDASLNGDQRDVLGTIIRNLNTLGRAESWCEARLSSDAESESANGHMIAAPLNGVEPDRECEIVRLLCPDPDAAFSDDHVVTVSTKTAGRGKNKQTIKECTTIYDPAWNICMETLQLHKERWSDPPGSRWVAYARPRNCFRIDPVRRRSVQLNANPRPQVIRFALDSSVLPRVTETLLVAEATRRALMSWHGRLTEHNGVRGRSDVLSGKDEFGHALKGHGHAHYLPTAEDADIRDRLTHLTLVARNGFGPEEMRAVDRLRIVKPRGRDNNSHPLRVLLLGYGRLDEYTPPPLKSSTVWVSATPYIATRYAKTRGRNRIELTSPQARADFLEEDLRRQVGSVLSSFNKDLIEGLEISPEWDAHNVFRLSRQSKQNGFRPIEFKRSRSKNDENGGNRLAGAFRLTFPEKVPGPISLGWAGHFGLGLFMPE